MEWDYETENSNGSFPGLSHEAGGLVCVAWSVEKAINYLALK